MPINGGETLNSIKRARVLAELSQYELARVIGVTPGCVSQWEKGMTHPRPKRLKQISEALNVPIAVLIDEHEVS